MSQDWLEWKGLICDTFLSELVGTGPYPVMREAQLSVLVYLPVSCLHGNELPGGSSSEIMCEIGLAAG